MVLFSSYILSRSSIMWKQKKRLVVGGKKHCVYVRTQTRYTVVCFLSSAYSFIDKTLFQFTFRVVIVVVAAQTVLVLNCVNFLPMALEKGKQSFMSLKCSINVLSPLRLPDLSFFKPVPP